MLTGNLDRVAELDTTTVDLDAKVLLDCVGDDRRGDGAEQLALFANVGKNLDSCTIELGAHGLSVGKASLLALGDVVLALLELLEVALGRLDGVTLGQQVVVGVTIGNFDNVAFAAPAFQFFKQNDFHGTSFA